MYFINFGRVNYSIAVTYLFAFAAAQTFAVIYIAGIHFAKFYAVFAIYAVCFIDVNSYYRVTVEKRIYRAEGTDKTAKKSVYKCGKNDNYY